MRAHKRVHAWANEYPTFRDGANMRARGILAELQAGTEGREEHSRHDDAQGWTSGGQHNMTDRALTWYPFSLISGVPTMSRAPYTVGEEKSESEQLR